VGGCRQAHCRSDKIDEWRPLGSIGECGALVGIHNIDPSFASAYVQTWYKQNPLDSIAATIAPGKLGYERFAFQFGLTPAETRVLAEIIAGKGLFAAAARLKISEATACTHAKRILAKTGTNRQTELIRRFLETALPRAQGSA
jgi:DNA-binding CsgD family transcriptional regulator